MKEAQKIKEALTPQLYQLKPETCYNNLTFRELVNSTTGFYMEHLTKEARKRLV